MNYRTGGELIGVHAFCYSFCSYVPQKVGQPVLGFLVIELAGEGCTVPTVHVYILS